MKLYEEHNFCNFYAIFHSWNKEKKFTALKQDNAKIRESDPDPETMKPYEEQIPIFVHRSVVWSTISVKLIQSDVGITERRKNFGKINRFCTTHEN